jgi:hypothetical protein
MILSALLCLLLAGLMAFTFFRGLSIITDTIYEEVPWFGYVFGGILTLGSLGLFLYWVNRLFEVVAVGA